MPVYEYQCSKCERRFEVFSRVMESPEWASCPKCSGDSLRALSSFASTDSGKLLLPRHDQVITEEAIAPLQNVDADAIRTAQDALEGLVREGAIGREAVDQARRTLAELEAELAQKRRDIAALQARIASLALELEDLQLRQHALSTEIAMTADERAGLLQEVSGIRQELDLLRLAHGEEIAEAERRRADMEGRISALMAAIQELEKRQQELRVQVALLEERRDTLSTEAQATEELRKWQGLRTRPVDEKTQADLKSARDEADRLRQEIARLRQEKNYLVGLTPTLKDRAVAEAIRVGEDAAAALRQSLQAMRDEVEGLLQQALEISGRAALIESEVRARAWLKPLADLVSGKLDLEAQQFRALAQLVLDPFAAWIEARPEMAPLAVSEDFQRLRRDLKEWVNRQESANNSGVASPR